MRINRDRQLKKNNNIIKSNNRTTTTKTKSISDRSGNINNTNYNTPTAFPPSSSSSSSSSSKTTMPSPVSLFTSFYLVTFGFLSFIFHARLANYVLNDPDGSFSSENAHVIHLQNSDIMIPPQAALRGQRQLQAIRKQTTPITKINNNDNVTADVAAAAAANPNQILQQQQQQQDVVAVADVVPAQNEPADLHQINIDTAAAAAAAVAAVDANAELIGDVDDLKFNHEWNNDVNGGITLVISDWEFAREPFIEYLKSEMPYFIQETIVIIPFEAVIDIPRDELKQKNVRIVRRGTRVNGNRDLCSIQINTKWFIATDTFHDRMRPQVPMFTTNGKIIVSAITMKESHCDNSPYCREDFAIAEVFGQTNPPFYFSEDFVYLTEMRNEYCKRVMPVYYDERYPYARFHANSYMAFLESLGIAEHLYKVVHISKFTCRPKFTFNSPPPLDDKDGCEIETSPEFEAKCPMWTHKDECIAMPECMYRPRFGCPFNNWNQHGEQPNLPVQTTDFEFKDDLITYVKDAHAYYSNPADHLDYVPVIPQTDINGPLPDKIFFCHDFFEHFLFYPYYEGEYYRLDFKGSMFFEEAFIPDEVKITRQKNLEVVKEHATENSLLLGNVLLLDECLPDAIVDFPGKILLRNSESQDFNFLTPGQKQLYPEFAKQRGLPEVPDKYNYLLPSDKVFVVGPHEDSPTSVRITYMAFVIANRFYDEREKLFNPAKKPKGNKQHFLIYSASHFVDYREAAANKFAAVGGEIHTAGYCEGRGIVEAGNCVPYPDNERPSHIMKSPHDKETHDTGVYGNYEMFSNYRFAMVLENTKLDGYITEKLLNAFWAGTIPIWYGTKDIFKIFNEKAIIYYDIENPEPALQRVAYLEKNPAAYDAMMSEPILANGQDTINEYFSIRDDVGDASLKKKVLTMTGHRDLASTAIFHSMVKEQ